MRLQMTPVGNPVHIRGSLTKSDPFAHTFSVKFDIPVVRESTSQSFEEFDFFVNAVGKIEDTFWGLEWDITQH